MDKFKFTLNKRKNPYDEYVVKAYKNGKYNEDATYYTDDWEDAVDTLKDIAKRQNLNVTETTKNSFIAESFKVNEKYDDTIEYKITGYTNRWSIIDDYTVNGKHYALLENNEWGDETYYLVVELGTEKMKNYHSSRTGAKYQLPTFDDIICETNDDIKTALTDEGII